MFFGQKIQQNKPISIQSPNAGILKLHLTNAALDVKSKDCQLYLKRGDKQILLLQLNRNSNMVWSSLNLMIDLVEIIELLAKRGEVHVCGHFIQEILKPQVDMPTSMAKEAQHASHVQYSVINPDKQASRTNRIKNINEARNDHNQQLSCYSKQRALSKESQSNDILQPFHLGGSSTIKPNLNINQTGQKVEGILQLSQPTRKSSRISRSVVSQKDSASKLHPEKDTKKEQKQEKKDQKSQSTKTLFIKQESPSKLKQLKKSEYKSSQRQQLTNGRYSLKALLANVDNKGDDQDDDQDDDDQQFSDLQESNSQDDDEESNDQQDDDGQDSQQEGGSNYKKKTSDQRMPIQSSDGSVNKQLRSELANRKSFSPSLIQQEHLNKRKSASPSKFNKIQIIEQEDQKKQTTQEQRHILPDNLHAQRDKIQTKIQIQSQLQHKFQDKWPSNSQSNHQSSLIQMREQHIQLLAKKMKFPTKRPTI